MNRVFLLMGCVCCWLSGPVHTRAHEFWIEPSTFETQPGVIVHLGLRNGERLAGQIVPRDSERIERFFAVGPQGEHDVVGRSGAPTSMTRAADPGWHTIVYHSKPAPQQLPAARFEDYLREEGLEHVVGLRAARGENNAPGREVYSRCAKALVFAGVDKSTGFSRRVGLPLEIVLESDPRHLDRDELLRLKVLFSNQPLEGVRVVGANERDPRNLLTATTDAQGQASFPAHETGTWLVTTLHMVRVDDKPDVDWESYWASLSFAIPKLQTETSSPTVSAAPPENAAQHTTHP